MFLKNKNNGIFEIKIYKVSKWVRCSVVWYF